jgi:hypothetical protein
MGIEEFLNDRAKKEGIQPGKEEIINKMLSKHFSPEQISEMIDEPIALILSIKNESDSE